MATTPLNNFPQAVSNLLIHEVLSVIAERASKEKNISLTVDEMLNWLSVPQTAKTVATPAGGAIQMPNLPNFLAGATPTSASAGGSGRSKKGPTGGPTCQYVFVRGVKKNQACGDPVVEGSIYCRACAKKKSAGGPGTGSSAGGAPAAAGADFRSVASTTAANAPTPAEDTSGLQVTAIRDRPGFYKTVKHGFIIRQQPDGAIVATLIDDNGNFRPLTAAEKAIAISIGIAVEDDGAAPPAAAETSPAAAAPAPIAAPTIAAVAPFPKPPAITVPRV